MHRFNVKLPSAKLKVGGDSSLNHVVNIINILFITIDYMNPASRSALELCYQNVKLNLVSAFFSRIL